jgi:virginiamycin B lyase
MSGRVLNRGLRDGRFCGLLIILIGFSPLRAQITEYSVPAGSLFNGLSGIAAGPDGAMWFSGNRNIGRITTAGVITVYPIPTSNAGSAAITAGPDGAMWFTESGINSGPAFAKIGRITTSGVITEYPLPDPSSDPTAITVGPDGALWFIESITAKIGRITTSGTITEFPLPPSEVSGGAWAITSGPDGNLWLTEYYGADKIVRMTTSGIFTEYTVASFVNSGSYGITVGPDGALWFADASFKIGRITTSGTITEYALTANDSPFGIAAGPDGALWYTDYSLGQIGRITTSGTVASLVPTPTNTAGGLLGYIAAGPDGAMWFTEVAGKIGRIPTSVTVTPPTITRVANAEGENAAIGPNTWIEIKGSNLAPPGVSSPACAPGYCWQASDFVNSQLPTALQGVSVTLNGEKAFVYFISTSQINILTPPDLAAGPVSVQVNNNGSFSAAFTAQAQTLSESFFVINGGPYIVATHLSTSACTAPISGVCLVGPATLYPGYSTPAQRNETIVIYANGFGSTTVPVVGGSETQSGSLPNLPVIQVGNATATVTFAGLISPGLYQFNVMLPATISTGDNTIQATYNGQKTQNGTLLTIQ